MQYAVCPSVVVSLFLLLSTPARAGDCNAVASVLDGKGSYSEQARINMTITRKDGQQLTRRLLQRVRRTGEETQLLIKFEYPSNLVGTGLLSVRQRNGSTTQWLYLPAFRRVRRVPSGDRSQSFLETDFLYEDLEPLRWGELSCKRLDDAEIGGQRVRVYEVTTHAGAESAYSKRKVFLSSSNTPLRVQFFNTRDEQIKELNNGEFKKVGKVWRPYRVQMHSLASGQKTTLEFIEINANKRLSANDFTTQALMSSIAAR